MECREIPDTDNSWFKITVCEWKLKEWFDADKFEEELRSINNEIREQEASDRIRKRFLFPDIDDNTYNEIISKVNKWEIKSSDALRMLNWETIPETINILK